MLIPTGYHWFSLLLPLRAIRKIKAKNNSSRNEVMALKELKNSSVLNLKKADKDTTVIMNNHNLSRHQ